MKKEDELPNTGERLLPGISSSWTEAHHVCRYQFAQTFGADKRVLDLGCGVGYGSELLAGTAELVVGCDISNEAISFAQTNYRRPNLCFLQTDCRMVGLQSANFDLVVSFEVIEHILEQATYLEEVFRLLKPGGTFIVSTPEKERYNAFLSRPNKFHRKELSEIEFLELLQSRFDDVDLSWQVVDPLAFTLLQYGAEIDRLRKRVSAIDRALRRPWVPLMNRISPNSIKSRFPRIFGNKLPDNEEIHHAKNSSWFNANYFSFQKAPTNETLYMIAICRK